jgi:hypothetical protein
MERGGRDSDAAVCRRPHGNSAPLQTINYEKIRDKVKLPFAYAKRPFRIEGEGGNPLAGGNSAPLLNEE